MLQNTAWQDFRNVANAINTTIPAMDEDAISVSRCGSFQGENEDYWSTARLVSYANWTCILIRGTRSCFVVIVRRWMRLLLNDLMVTRMYSSGSTRNHGLYAH